MRTLASLAASLVLVACSSQPAAAPAAALTAGAEAAPRFSRVSIDEVAAGLGQLAVLDANSRETFDEHHVPGARWVDYDGLTAADLPADPAAPVVFYCANEHCTASHTAAEAAIDLGHTHVSVMGAGIQGWVAAGQPVETATP